MTRVYLGDQLIGEFSAVTRVEDVTGAAVIIRGESVLDAPSVDGVHCAEVVELEWVVAPEGEDGG